MRSVATAAGIQDLSTVSDHLPVIASFKAADQ